MRFAIVCLGLALIPDTSKAQITQTIPFDFLPNGSVNLTFDKFDGQGGTRQLLSVLVSVELMKTGGTAAVDNDSNSDGEVILTHTVTGHLAAVGNEVTLLDNSNAPIPSTGGLQAVSSFVTSVAPTSGDGTGSFDNTGAGDFVTFSPGPTTITSSGTIGSLYNLQYTASPDDTAFDLQFSAQQSASYTGVSGLQQLFTVSRVSGAVTVAYNYILVPEASSAALCGMAFLGMNRRRRSGLLR
ncbi:MAG: hypothetical protein JWM59_3486 [Verrucomicrobiales bacterium]|nr:hypothetical protein [Verrucomicrobiales bacterium]